MKHLLKSYEHERAKNTIMWDLTFYDDETESFETISEIQVVDEEI